MGDRAYEALEAVDWIERKSRAADTDLIIYAGDFNTESGDLPHRILTRMGGFDDSRIRFVPTYDDPRNSYKSAPDARPIAIDYVMHRPANGANFATETLEIGNPLAPKVKHREFRCVESFALSLMISWCLEVICGSAEGDAAATRRVYAAKHQIMSLLMQYGPMSTLSEYCQSGERTKQRCLAIRIKWLSSVVLLARS